MTASALRKERDRFLAFAFASADILAEIDDEGRIAYIDGALGMLGCDKASLYGTSFFDLVRPECRAEAHALLRRMRRAYRTDPVSLKLRSGGRELPVRVTGLKVSLDAPSCYLSVSAEAPRTGRDGASGLPETNVYVEAVSHRLITAQSSGAETRVTLLDLPELKGLLDTLPEEASRLLLREIEDYLRARSLGGDAAGRIGEGAYSLAHDAAVAAEDIVRDLIAITQRADPSGKGSRARIATMDGATAGLSEQDTANALLYTISRFAREAGDGFHITSLAARYEDMLQDAMEHIARFKKTVEGADFEIAFQPVVDVKNDTVHHFECLVRLKSGEKFPTPFSFIRFGEEAGVIGEFDLAMLQKTLDALKAEEAKGLRPNVAVNISGKSVSSKLFMDMFARLLDDAPALRKQIIVEITESSRIGDMKQANEFIQKMRGKGNAFCLDDFGSGESSFDYLRNLQVDYIKIDGGYIHDAVKTPRGRKMLKAMAALCESMSVMTIGEMVENEEEAKFLSECGIHFGQGYHYGKPTTDASILATGGGKIMPHKPRLGKVRRVASRPAAAAFPARKRS